MKPTTPGPEQRLAQTSKPAEDALRLHPFYRGKMQVMPKCAIRGLEDFAIWYSPGVAAPCRAIQADPELVYAHTNKGNSIAIVTDGTRVLGLGDIGPEAGLPVMEGKAMLFKYLGGVDAVPICLATKDPDELVRTVKLLEPTFGGINLEDIAQPKCFRVLDELRRQMSIPVWHDDQQGTATALLAGLLNALKVVGKDLGRIRIVMVGIGAANVAGYRLLTTSGVEPGADRGLRPPGHPAPGPHDIEARSGAIPGQVARVPGEQRRRLAGGIAEALRGADVCAAFSASGPGIIEPEWVRGMARDAIVFACANPVPEIWPWEAKAAGARVVATGRGDSRTSSTTRWSFRGSSGGSLDVRARTDHRRDGERPGARAGRVRRGARRSARTTSCRAWTSGRCFRAWRPRRALPRRRRASRA